MRRDSALKGLRSAFSRATRRVKTLFGWREAEDETADMAAIMLVGQQIGATKQSAKSNGNADDDDGDGSGSTSSRWHVPDTDAEPERGDVVRRIGYDENGEPINYGDKMAQRRFAERERMRKLFDDEGDEEPSDAKEERERDSDSMKKDQQFHDQQLLHNQRIVNRKAARAREAMSLEEKEAEIKRRIEQLGGDSPEPAEEPDKGPEYG